MERVITYIDGFNLYFGLRSKGWRRFYWLDVHLLAQNLLKPGQQLIQVKYFTSRVSATPTNPDQDKRQTTYLEALATRSLTSLFFGHYLSKPVTCRECGASWRKNEEKMTDVNIAMELLADAFQNRFDTALLISADSDLTGPVVKVRHLYPKKRVVIAFPPARVSDRLKREAAAYFTVGHVKIARSQLPDQVVKPGGYVLRKPSEWR